MCKGYTNLIYSSPDTLTQTLESRVHIICIILYYWVELTGIIHNCTFIYLFFNYNWIICIINNIILVSSWDCGPKNYRPAVTMSAETLNISNWAQGSHCIKASFNCNQNHILLSSVVRATVRSSMRHWTWGIVNELAAGPLKALPKKKLLLWNQILTDCFTFPSGAN